MFVPPYDVLLSAMGKTRQQVESQSEVIISVKLFKFLLQQIIESGTFNEEGYLAANPDVAEALKKNQIASAEQHYRERGYFECRRGATPFVNEVWYKKKYADVAEAVRTKKIASATDHYNSAGVFEFRSPNEDCERQCSSWKLATQKARRI